MEWALFKKNYIQKCNRPQSVFPRKNKKKWHRFNTQVIRRELSRNLGVLHEMAFEIAQNTTLPLEDRERWTKIAAYIVQTINTVSRTYDSMKIEETLDELEKYVEDNSP